MVVEIDTLFNLKAELFKLQDEREEVLKNFGNDLNTSEFKKLEELSEKQRDILTRMDKLIQEP